jgi:ArsR family transcriptional regulator
MPKTPAPTDTPKKEVCSIQGIHRQVIRTVRNRMPESENFDELARFYKLFGDRTRLGIIWVLGVSEMCVCDLCVLLGMKQSAISHQLRSLKQTQIVKFRREDKVVFYSLNDDHIREVLEVGYKHMQERR